MVDILFIEIEAIEHFLYATHGLIPAFACVLADPFCTINKVLIYYYYLLLLRESFLSSLRSSVLGGGVKVCGQGGRAKKTAPVCQQREILTESRR